MQEKIEDVDMIRKPLDIFLIQKKKLLLLQPYKKWQIIP